QSVNVALTVADRAYFMEKGEIRFEGPTAELLDRPDVLRSVFLTGTAAALSDVMDVDGSPRPRSRASVSVTGGRGTEGPDVDAASAAALEVRNVSVSFGGVRALDQVDLTVAPGEIVGLIGPNGAGKTTLLNVVSGLVPVTSGEVILHGEDLSERSSANRALRGLGRSFQDSRLFPSLTVEEVLLVALDRWLDVRDPFNAALRLPAYVDSEADARHRVDELIELLGLQAFRSKFIGELSTGSRRVVDLGCVLAHEPSVVLLDEPSSGIAQREAEALGPMLLALRDRLDASLVVIEHDMSLISSVSDRLVAFDQGRVVTDGTPDEVLAHPAVVESYLGGDAAVIGRSGSTDIPASDPQPLGSPS
ncbi:MAG: ATP-binding cassette domain-containing protein, partial [Acidimicrobiales bacterium]|nr:ATP-binding cassette domain-containing protein [Acidimicrobiales bacterium]